MPSEQSMKEELKTYQITSKLSELLDLFSNGEKFYDNLDEYIFSFETSGIFNVQESEKIANELKIDFDYVRLLFYDNVLFNKRLEQIATDAIESYLTYKINDNSNVDINLNLELDNETVTATIKTHRTLDEILSEGMNAYGDFDYYGHSEEDRNALKNDFYYILKYLIYYYIACNGGAVKPHLKIEEDLENHWSWPNQYQLEEICKKAIN